MGDSDALIEDTTPPILALILPIILRKTLLWSNKGRKIDGSIQKDALHQKSNKIAQILKKFFKSGKLERASDIFSKVYDHVIYR